MNLMEILKAVILGVVEGATEFIPVSSTGHLILAADWLNFTGTTSKTFIVFIQLGAILAIVWLYRRKFLDLAVNWNRDSRGRRLIANLIIGSIPAVVIGLPADDWIEAHLFKPIPVSMALVAGGLAILWIERSHRTPTVHSVDDVSVRTAFGIGAIQVLAILFPGVSRSGATIMGGLVLGLSRTAATEFSFFLAIPAMMGASFISLVKARNQIAMTDIPQFAVGFVVSFVAALVVVRILVAFVSHKSFAPFAWYRIVFGLVVLSMYWNHGGF